MSSPSADPSPDRAGPDEAPSDVDGVLRAAASRARVSRVVQWVTVTAFCIVAGVAAFFVVGVGTIVHMMLRDFFLAPADHVTFDGEGANNFFAQLFMPVYVVLAVALIAYILFVLYLAYFFAPGVVLFPLLGVVAARWKSPIRIVLLRPFHDDPSAQRLRRLVSEVIAPFGHVYTLADSRLKTSWLVRLPVLLGQLGLFAFRYRKLTRPAHVAGLDASLDRRWWRNMNWLVSRTKIFPLRCSDELWQEAVRRLLTKADVVVADVTSLREAVAWELDLCHEFALRERMIVIGDLPEQLAARFVGALHVSLDVDAGSDDRLRRFLAVRA